MQLTNSQISDAFSYGNFSFCYDYFANEVVWNIIGNKTLTGKDEVIAYCEKMSKEMASSTLANSNIIGNDEAIAVQGKCTFVDAENKPGEVAYCDVFRFNDGKITSINSYCI